jgi:hypothetical protein
VFFNSLKNILFFKKSVLDNTPLASRPLYHPAKGLLANTCSFTNTIIMRNYHQRSTHLQRARQHEQNNGEIPPEEIQRNRERAQRGINKYIAKYKEHMAQQAAISQPGDDPDSYRDEKEADEVARKVSEGDEKQVDISTPPQGNNIQRNADEEEVMPKSEEEVMPKSDDDEVMCKNEEEGLMAKSEDGGLHATEELQAKLETNKGGGQAMDDKTKSEMEGKMRADLGDVRIHTGTERMIWPRASMPKRSPTGRMCISRMEIIIHPARMVRAS